MIAIGLMSGTSLDGVDAALVGIQPRDGGYALELLRFETFTFDGDLSAAMRAVLPPQSGSVAALASLHRALGQAFARAARGVAGSEQVGYVASHGHTVWHDGARNVTLQVGDPFSIRESLNATVCYDFRSADCAAGGHGAPLVPYVDALLFSSPREDRAALNIGGIANVTLLSKGDGRHATAFDTGPGNILMDAFVRERSHGARAMDCDGTLAASGTVESALLTAMLADDYFAQAPPKTTGRERFGSQFLSRFAGQLAELSVEDGLATLAEVTAVSVSDAVRANDFAPVRVIASGGGTRNGHLMSRIAARLSPARVETSDVMGVDPEAKEAMTFAVLGYETLRGRAGNVPQATGAARAVPLGAIAPYRLHDLLAEVERECRGSS